MYLVATTDTIELLTSSTANLDYVVNYADHTSTTFTPGSSRGTISSATSTVLLAAPAASTQRQVLSLTIRNRHASSANTVSVKIDVSGTEYLVTPAIPLASGESLEWLSHTGWLIYSDSGDIRIPGGSTVDWGNITGTLSNQTDLQAALDALDPIPLAVAL